MTLHENTHLLNLYMKKLKYRDIEQLGKTRAETNWQSKDSNPAA